MDGCTVEWIEGDGVTTLQLAGNLDELFEVQKLPDRLDGPVAIDTLAVRRVNSVGVARWVSFLQLLCEKAQSVALVRCSPSIVLQLNTIVNFRASARVASVAAPFVCPDCDASCLIEVDLPPATSDPSSLIRDTHACPECGRAGLVFNEIPSRYFAFLDVEGDEA
jgi:hypothetical protein